MFPVLSVVERLGDPAGRPYAWDIQVKWSGSVFGLYSPEYSGVVMRVLYARHGCA